MKRQSVLSSFFQPKVMKLADDVLPTTSTVTSTNLEQEPDNIEDKIFISMPCDKKTEESRSGHDVTSITSVDDNISDNGLYRELPECWSLKQFKYFEEKYTWLEVKGGKLGCKICRLGSLGVEKGKHFHIASAWVNYNVNANGSTKIIQQASFRKKLNEHALSQSHSKIELILKQSGKESLATCIEKANKKSIEVTARIFNIVYSLAKQNRPMSDMEREVELQIKNGVDLGTCLHSRYSAIRVIEHISSEIKKQLFNKIIENNAKVCIILDEASTIAKRSVLVIYLKCALSLCPDPITVFIELKELENTTAEGILNTLLQCLNEHGFTRDFLLKNLIGLCCDGASVLLGKISGVSAQLSKIFPNIIVWHCLNHRLQLALDDSIKDINEINHFKIFLDEIYSIYHKSNKNQTDIRQIASDLEIEILKFGRVFGPRWSACSLRAAKAVWNAYPALYTHFAKIKKFSGMANRMVNKNFLCDLALMIDILEEISLLSNAFQSRSTTMPKADRLMRRTIRALEVLKDSTGKYENELQTVLNSQTFKHIPFKQNDRCTHLPRNRLIQSVIDNIKNRLLSADHVCLSSLDKNLKDKDKYQELINIFNLIDTSSWCLEKVFSPWIEAENKLPALEKLLKYEIDRNEFRDFVDSYLESRNNVPPSIMCARKIANTISISSAEAERGFSVMNDIATNERSNITIKHISDLMTIKIIGKPLSQWDATPFVKSWIRKRHRDATDTRIRKKAEIKYSENELQIWALI